MLSIRFNLLQGAIFSRAEKPFKFMIHLQVGQTNFPHMPRQFRVDLRTAGDQDHFVTGQRPAYFEAAIKMTDPQNMLAVLDVCEISERAVSCLCR